MSNANWVALCEAKEDRITALKAALVAEKRKTPILVREVVDERDRLKAERDAWKNMAELRNQLLAYYRAQSHPSQALMKKLDKARDAIAALTKEPTDA